MSEVIMLCGKVCSGKSFYANNLKKEGNIVVLSVDELMLSMFPEQLGDEHNTVAAKAKEFLLRQAENITAAGTNILLDFGFWFKSERDSVRTRFEALGHRVKLVYIDASKEIIMRNALKRNSEKELGNGVLCYEADETLLNKCDELFEVPDAYECDEVISVG